MIARRTLLSGGAALAAGAMLRPVRAKTALRAPRLRPGDTVALVEPAGFSDDAAQVERVAQTIRGMGLVPKVGTHVGARYGYLAGTDEQRAADLNAAFADPAVRAVFAMRGGWGSARVLPLLDWALIRRNPKLLVGFSDITALHLAFAARAGYPTIHGPNAGNSWRKESWESLWRLAFTGETPTLASPAPDPADPLQQSRWQVETIRAGTARGPLLGGNLSVLAALVGTPWLPDLRGAILFLEDTGEAEYRIDRMMSQLQLSGILDQLAGFVFGQCTRCSAGVEGYSGLTLPQILEHYIAPLGIPAFGNANVGHVANQLCLPSGGEVEIDAAAGTIRLLRPIVA